MEIVVEPPTEPPAPPRTAIYPDLPKPEYHSPCAVGQAYEADCGAIHCLTRPVHQYACYNSCLVMVLSGYDHDCMNKLPVGPQPSEEVIRLVVFPLPLAIHPELGELPAE